MVPRLDAYATDRITIRNNLYQLARKLKVVNDALRECRNNVVKILKYKYMATMAKLKPERNLRGIQDGQRVATGTESVLYQYGLSQPL